MPRKKVQPRGDYGEGTLFKKGNQFIWRVRIDGVRKDFGTGKTTEAEASEWRRDKLAELRNGPALVVAPVAAVLVNELLDDYITYMETHELSSASGNTGVINSKIRPFFGNKVAKELTTADGNAYRKTVIKAGFDNSTANRHLSILTAALNRGIKNCTPPKLDKVPFFDKTDESKNVRTGFIGDPAHDAILAALCASLKAIFICGYNTGVRSGELKKFMMEWVHFDAKAIIVPGYWKGKRITKSGEPHTIPFMGDMEEALLEQKRVRDAEYPDCEHVFFWRREDVTVGRGGSRVKPGSPLKDMRGSWGKAAIAAGHPNLRFHDLRRSGVRNMDRAGVPQTVRMSITGHKTDSMDRRYNIADTADLAEAARKLQAWRDANASTV